MMRCMRCRWGEEREGKGGGIGGICILFYHVLLVISIYLYLKSRSYIVYFSKLALWSFLRESSSYVE